MNICMIFLILIASLIGCGSNPASAPITPIQIPTSIEYAGGEASGEIPVMMGKTLEFVARDADGNMVTDPSVVDTQIIGSDGSEITGESCGTVAISDSNIVYTAANAYCNVASEITLEFTYSSSSSNLADILKADLEAAVLAQPNIITTVSPDAITSAVYNFDTSPVLISDNYAVKPVVTVISTGVAFGCFVEYEDSNLMITKSTDSGRTWSTPARVDISTYTPGMCAIAAFDSSNIAVGWSATTQVDDLSSAYYYVAFSSDGGLTFGSPQKISVDPVQTSTGPMHDYGWFNIVYDQNGLLHAVYWSEKQVEQYVYNAYYAYCSADAGCSGTTMFNETADVLDTGLWPTSGRLVPLAVDGTGPVKIYSVWANDSDPAQTALYMGEINYTSGQTPTLVRNERADNLSGTYSSYDVYGPNIIIDRNGAPVIVFSGSDKVTGLSNIYLAKWFSDGGSGGAFGPNIQVSDLASNFISNFSTITSDASNNLHILFSYVPLDSESNADWNASGVRHTMTAYVGDGGLADSLDSVPSRDVFIGLGSNDTINTVNDRAGRTYVIWAKAIEAEGGMGIDNWEVYAAIGDVH